MDGTNPTGTQPDISALARMFRSAGDEIEKFQNMPAIASGERILAEIQQMRQDLAATRRELRTALTTTRQDLVTMMTASNHNNAARVQNSLLSSRSEQLSPFLNSSTGAIVVGFPATSADIERMNEENANAVLQQLGLQTTVASSLAAKRRQLRGYIGLKEQPI